MIAQQQDPTALLAPYSDCGRLLQFCQREPIGYRHIIHYLSSPVPDYDAALAAYYPGMAPVTSSRYFVDNTEHISLLADNWDGRLRLEGNETHVSKEALQEWCAQQQPRGAASTSESLTELLQQVVSPDGWSVNFHYSVTPERFRECRQHRVSELSPANAQELQQFFKRSSDTPFLTIERANVNLSRDIGWMNQGLPVKVYGVYKDGSIVGLCSVFQMTAACDEVSRLYVPKEFRGRGYGKSLLSAATKDILAQNRQPGFAVGGDLEVLGRLLGSLGYSIACRFWHWRYWWDVPVLAKSGRDTASHTEPKGP